LLFYVTEMLKYHKNYEMYAESVMEDSKNWTCKKVATLIKRFDYDKERVD